jgi:hypothetical protein
LTAARAFVLAADLHRMLLYFKQQYLLFQYQEGGDEKEKLFENNKYESQRRRNAHLRFTSSGAGVYQNPGRSNEVGGIKKTKTETIHQILIRSSLCLFLMW